MCSICGSVSCRPSIKLLCGVFILTTKHYQAGRGSAVGLGLADSSRGEEGAGGRNLVQRGAGLELEEELARLLQEEGEDLEGGLGGKKQ